MFNRMQIVMENIDGAEKWAKSLNLFVKTKCRPYGVHGAIPRRNTDEVYLHNKTLLVVAHARGTSVLKWINPRNEALGGNWLIMPKSFTTLVLLAIYPMGVE